MTEKLDWKELDALSKEFFEIAEGHSCPPVGIV